MSFLFSSNVYMILCSNKFDQEADHTDMSLLLRNAILLEVEKDYELAYRKFGAHNLLKRSDEVIFLIEGAGLNISGD